MSDTQNIHAKKGKEQQVLEYVLSTLDANGPPEKVLLAIEHFAETTSLMIVGPQKGQYVLGAIRETEPTIVIELGCYLGYSAILFGLELAKQNEKYSKGGNTPARYYSFEISPEYADIARQMVDFAGLSDTIEIIVGPAGRTIPDFQHRLREQVHLFTPADIVFLDHAKDYYVPDLRVLESSGLIAPDTLIFADNVSTPGALDYVRYVQSSPEYRRGHNEHVKNVSNPELGGRWNILYESKTVPVTSESTGHPDAVEITKCVSYLSG